MSWNSKRKSGFVEYYDSILFVLVLAIWALIGILVYSAYLLFHIF